MREYGIEGFNLVNLDLEVFSSEPFKNNSPDASWLEQTKLVRLEGPEGPGYYTLSTFSRFNIHEIL